jgi:hypothetical protein
MASPVARCRASAAGPALRRRQRSTVCGEAGRSRGYDEPATLASRRWGCCSSGQRAGWVQWAAVTVGKAGT